MLVTIATVVLVVVLITVVIMRVGVLVRMTVRMPMVQPVPEMPPGFEAGPIMAASRANLATKPDSGGRPARSSPQAAKQADSTASVFITSFVRFPMTAK